MSALLKPSEVSRRLQAIAATVDREALAAELAKEIRGEVRFDDGSLALYTMDASNYRQVPLGVVIPRDVNDILATVAVARRYGAPVLARGGGTSLCGQTCNVAVVIDTSKYLNRILEIDPNKKLARVEPGVVLDDLRDAAERHGLTFGPDPATHSRCTLGGMIGNNSCGTHSIMAGKTVENVEALEILTYDGLRLWVGKTSEDDLERIVKTGGRQGEIYAGLKALRDKYTDFIRAGFPKIRRRVSGYNLDQLLPENGFNVARALVGTEGTCVLVLQAQAQLLHSPPARALLVLGYPDIYQAGDETSKVLSYGPIGLEGLDEQIVGAMRKKKLHLNDLPLLPRGAGWLLVEFGGATRQEASARAHRLLAALKTGSRVQEMRLFEDPAQQKCVWAIRESGAAATNFTPGERETWPGWEDAAVDPNRLGDYLRDFRKLLDKCGYSALLYGHFGDGCVHARITFDFHTEEGIKQWRRFLEEAADLVVRYGGSLSGEHGDGQARAELLPRMYGKELIQAFREFKAIWDPGNKMNPGKVVDPYRLDENLRHGPDYRPLQPATNFSFFKDQGSFATAVGRCVGIGICRRKQGGTMCPSYRATLEEQHSTRGRAHLLFEMLQGESTKRLWRNPHIKQALDLCLACKGCKSDCPVSVDMATYKAEFLSHYYAGRLRPIQAYSMGLIFRWARLAAFLPGGANFFTQTPMLRDIVKLTIGMTRSRNIPVFARQTFTQWFKRRAAGDTTKPAVILWPDTFNNHFYPEAARAAVEVLEAAGYQVRLPRQVLCCGRPLYDFGMLDLARQKLREILHGLKADIAAGVPVIGLEPSCIAVFRDELLDFFPDEPMARRLSQQAYSLSEFLIQKADWHPPKLSGKAIVHGHCHDKAVIGMSDETQLLKRLGLDYHLLDSGCCGMAGAFGFHEDHYELSIRIGEKVLLPAVRGAGTDTLIITNGFSCREQIAQTTLRRALHLAQVLQMALTRV